MVHSASPITRIAGVTLIAAWVLACQGGTASDNGELESSSTSAESTESGTSEDTGDTGESTTTGEEPAPTTLARGGIEIASVAANHAIEIPIGAGGQGIPGDERVGFLVSGRRTLFRAYWDTLPADWEARELEARLLLGVGGEEALVFETTEWVEGDAGPADLAQSFDWVVEAEAIVPGLEFRVELHELDPPPDLGPEPEVPPTLPWDGSAFVGIEPSPQEIEMVVVPVRHQIDGCDNVPEVTQDDLEWYTRELEQLYPVQQAIVTAREPFVYTESIGGPSDYSPLLSALSQLRTADAPAPNVFYYGVVLSCDGGPGGIAGQAYSVPPPTMGAAYQRVAVGNYIGGAMTSDIIMIHELGHSLGRLHVWCNGEGNTDPDYPHAGGIINVWGWSIHSEMHYAPDEWHDVMSYCFTYWISDYGWNLSFDLIRTLTSWNEGGPTLPPASELLVGALYPDGEEDWWVTPGTPPSRAPDGWAELEDGDRAVRLPAWASPRHESQTVEIVVPLDAPLSASARLVLMRDARIHRVRGDELTRP